jgi:hypothetical protein
MNSKKETKRWVEMRFLLALMLILIASTVEAQMASENYEIRCSSLNSGGGQTSSANFEMQSSFGQATPTGTSESATYGLHSGFLPVFLWGPLSPCVDFEDLTSGTFYHYMDNFVSRGVTITVRKFQDESGNWIEDFASVETSGIGCGSGQDMLLVGVNLKFDFGRQITGLSMSFRHWSPNINIKINDDFRNVNTFADIHRANIGGVDVLVSGSGSSECGGLILAGTIDTFAIGGWEMWIDDVCEEVFAPLLVGDVNGDMAINVLDVLAVVNHILGVDELTEDALVCADCNCDGTCNILDCIGIVNVILGIGECGPGACKMELTDEALEFLKALKPYFPAEEFDKLLSLVKPEVQVPNEYNLSQNYPNPFNPTTTIQFTLPHGGRSTETGDRIMPVHTTLKIYNLLGQEVRTLVDEVQDPGYYTATWDGQDSFGNEVASGVYFYRLSVASGQWSETKRMVLLK